MSVIVEIKDRACILNTSVVHVADEPKDDMAESLANVSIVEKGFVDEFNQSVDINEIILQEKLSTNEDGKEHLPACIENKAPKPMFTVEQVEAMLERVKTQYHAEKRVLI